MTVKTKDISLRYRSPEIKVIEVKAQHVLCQSNEPMGEDDISGSFTQN